MLILLTIEALLFGLFTTCMACEQITSVMYNQTYIDRLQAKRGDVSKSTNHGILGNLREVFGDADSYLNWLVPTVASWKDRDEIMGYTVPVKVEEEEALLSQDLEDPQIKNEPAGETDVEMNEMVEVSLASPKHGGPRERVTQKNEETQLRGDDAL